MNSAKTRANSLRWPVRVFNKQRRQPVDADSLRDFAQILARRLKSPGGFSLVLVSDRVMAGYNRRYRGKQGPTDVLSFPDQEKEEWEQTGEAEDYLGDIVISVETACRRMQGDDLHRELRRLSLHGLLHLLGYDHETDQGQMEAMEARCRKEFDLI